MRLTAIGGAILLLVSTSMADQSQAPVFRARADMVRVEASVTRDDRPVAGLRASDFVVKDNGVVQEIVDLQFESLPIDVTVALDVSTSVNGPMLARLRAAIQALMSDLRAGDRLKLLLFDTRVQRLVDFTTDFGVVDAALRNAVVGGGTAFTDAISVALSSAVAADRRHLVVFFTDGVDGHSISEPQTVVDIARRSSATLTFVNSPQASLLRATPSQRRGLALMDALASLTGGEDITASAGRAPSPQVSGRSGGIINATPTGTSDLTSTFRRVLQGFRSEYVLFFRPTGVERGGVHTLSVTTKSNLVVRARRSYVGE